MVLFISSDGLQDLPESIRTDDFSVAAVVVAVPIHVLSRDSLTL